MTELSDVVQSSEAKVLATIMQGLREDMTELKVDVGKLTNNIAELVRLQVEHQETRNALQRAFTALDQHQKRDDEEHKFNTDKWQDADNRLRAIEREMPALREGRKWLVGIASVCLVMLLTALVASVLIPRTTMIEMVKSAK